MKGTKIAFWISTVLIFLFEGVMPALSFQSDMAKAGIEHLGYPMYFGTMLMIAKVSGALTLILPMMPIRLKEWAYAGFTFSILAALYSNVAVDGVTPMTTLMPLAVLAVLMVSYFSFHRLHKK